VFPVGTTFYATRASSISLTYRFCNWPTVLFGLATQRVARLRICIDTAWLSPPAVLCAIGTRSLP